MFICYHILILWIYITVFVSRIHLQNGFKLFNLHNIDDNINFHNIFLLISKRTNGYIYLRNYDIFLIFIQFYVFL